MEKISEWYNNISYCELSPLWFFVVHILFNILVFLKVNNWIAGFKICMLFPEDLFASFNA